MRRAPALAAIHAAELRVAQSMRGTGDGLRRVRAASRVTLSRLSTVVLVAGAAGLLGLWIARRRQPGALSSSGGAAVARTASIAGLVRTFIVRHGMQHWFPVLQQMWAARRKRAADVGPGAPG